VQHALYRAAKADPGRRFHALRDKVYRRDVLWRAWVTVYRNGGAPGIDKTTLARSSSTASTGCSMSWPGALDALLR
jgi:RNA-directed DNA polymerase